MVLSGAMFSFDKLNRKIGNVDKVPLIAELMPTRWTYEALIVSQFKDNKYSQTKFTREGDTYYDLEKKRSEAEFNKVHRIKALREALETTLFEFRSNPKNIGNNEELLIRKSTRKFTRLLLLKNELEKMAAVYHVPSFNYISDLTPYEFNPGVADSLTKYLDRMDKIFNRISNAVSDRKDSFYNMNDLKLKKIEDGYYNYKLLEIVTKPYERKKILVYNNTLVQNTDPIYLDPYKKGFLSFRTHFYAPSKYIFGMKTDTFIFNISIVLLSSIFLYLALYFELLGRAVRFFENLKFRK
jgi:ABC transport system ATP-binding/permease protein